VGFSQHGTETSHRKRQGVSFLAERPLASQKGLYFKDLAIYMYMCIYKHIHTHYKLTVQKPVSVSQEKGSLFSLWSLIRFVLIKLHCL
jgi:hypothetical protein